METESQGRDVQSWEITKKPDVISPLSFQARLEAGVAERESKLVIYSCLVTWGGHKHFYFIRNLHPSLEIFIVHSTVWNSLWWACLVLSHGWNAWLFEVISKGPDERAVGLWYIYLIRKAKPGAAPPLASRVTGWRGKGWGKPHTDYKNVCRNPLSSGCPSFIWPWKSRWALPTPLSLSGTELKSWRAGVPRCAWRATRFCCFPWVGLKSVGGRHRLSTGTQMCGTWSSPTGKEE